jgi:hypothetical protein
MSDIRELQQITHRLRGAKTTHVQSVPVKESFQGKTVWDGAVEVFDLKALKANRIDTWACDTGDPVKPKRHVALLDTPPVVSPETAVRVAIVQESSRRDRSKGNWDGQGLPRGCRRWGLRIRVTPDELQVVEAAAKAKKQAVSEWIRSTLNAAIRG